MEDCEAVWSSVQICHVLGELNTLVAYYVARKPIIQLKDGELIIVVRWQCINYTSSSLIQER